LRAKLITILKIVVSLGLVLWVFSRVNLIQVRAQLASANPGFLALALALYVLAIGINAFKWQILLHAQEVRVPFGAALEFQFIGFFFNNFLPMLGGDLMRGFGLGRHTDSTTRVGVSVLVDRIIGLLAYMTTAVLAALLAVTITGRTDLEEFEWVALVAMGVLGLGFAVLLSRRLRGLVSRLFAWRWLAPLSPLWERISAAFNAYRFQYRALGLAFAVGFLGILATTFVNWSLSQSMGGLMPVWAILLFNPLIALVGMVPIFIAGLGVNQTAYPFFFGLVGVPADFAVAVSLLMQVVIICGSLPGGYFWLRGRRKKAAGVPSLG
jgi:uncharacterized protein (TIRG00374 family)